MPYTFARSPAPIDKSKNTPGVDTSDIITRRRIQTIGSFVCTNGVLGSTKKAMQAAKGGNYILALTLNSGSGCTQPIIVPTQIAMRELSSDSNSQDIFIAQYTSTGSVNWIARIAGALTDSGFGISTDSSGNIIVTGYYDSNPLTVYDKYGTPFASTLTNTDSGTVNIFIVQYSSTGSVNWVAQISGSGTDVGLSVSTDSAGNIIVTGYYSSNPLTFYNKNNGTAFATTLANSGGNDGFIAQYSSAGNVNWVAQIAGGGYDGGKCISTDSSGNIIVTGNYNTGPLTFYNKNNGTAFASTLANSGINDIFIAQYSSAGNVNWVTQIAGTLTDTPSAVCTDSAGNINVTGYYASSSLTFYNKNNGTAFASTLANSGSNDVFIAQYSSAGNVNWVAQIAGSAGESETAITTDSTGNINVTGTYDSTTLTCYNKNNGTAFASTLANSGSNDVFIAQYSSAGNVNWVARIGSGGYDAGKGISTDSNGKINIIGTYNSGPLTFYNKNNGTAFASTLANSGSTDTFIAQYSSTGDVTWVAQVGGTAADTGSGISTDSTGKINVIGYYSSSPLKFYDKNGNQF